MGVFRSVRGLQKQARQMEQSLPPAGERMRTAQDRMAGASEMLAAQMQAATAAASAAAGLASGASARRTVMITGMRQIGTVNFDLLVEFELTVMGEGMAPYPVTTQQAISQLQAGQLRPGLTLQAAVDTASPSAVWLDLTSVR
jgi:hypothetical protein